MGRSRRILWLSIFITIVAGAGAVKKPKPPVFLLTVMKDKASKLYYTHQYPLPNMALDLGGSSVLLGCSPVFKNSATYHPILCHSSKCKLNMPDFCFKNTTCGKIVNASFLGRAVNARLGQDNVSLSYTSHGAYTWTNEIISSSLLITCTDDNVLKSLPPIVSGTMGLSKTLLSLPSQLASVHNTQPKFALCLPSKPGNEFGYGDLYIGGGPYYMLPYTTDVRKIFGSTPLITKPSGEYFIDVKSIGIAGEAIALGTSILGGTKVCTMTPYSILHTSIYNALAKAFVRKAKMTQVAAVKPFGACFSSKGLGKSMMGPGVPVIELVLRGGAKWRIYGSNSLVKVNKDVVCLGFVDGGNNMKPSIVIGGLQMEDNVVEFDLKVSKFSFSSSLLLHNTSCSHFRLM